MALISDPVSAVAGVVQSIINKFPDAAQKEAAQSALAQMYLNGELQQMTTQAGVITAEVNSQSWLARSWRPCLMFSFIALILNNYLLAPYLQAMFGVGLQLALPPEMWALLKLGIGGYVVGRSVEKTAVTLTGTSAGTKLAQAASNVFKGQ